MESIFRTQFHHAVVTDLRMVLAKQDLDDAFREKRFSDNIKVELIFEQWTGQQIVLGVCVCVCVCVCVSVHR